MEMNRWGLVGKRNLVTSAEMVRSHLTRVCDAGVYLVAGHLSCWTPAQDGSALSLWEQFAPVSYQLLQKACQKQEKPYGGRGRW